MTTSPPPTAAALALRGAITAFLGRFDAFLAATGRKEGGVSDSILGASRKVRELRAGGGIGVFTLADAEDRLARLAAEAGITLPDLSTGAESGAESPRPLAVGE